MGPEFQAYVGPQPFYQKDRAIFFGRDRETRDLLSIVSAHDLVLVYAQSGAGKTSLINAGLIPLLKENQFEVLPVARFKGTLLQNVTLDEISNICIFNALTSWAEGAHDVERLAKTKLVDFLNAREHMLDEDGMPLPRVVIFDQFEEIFSSYQDRWKDREGFFKQVSTALEADSLLRIVFVMREDFIAQLDPYAYLLPEKLRTRFHIEPLRREAALQAVKEPLKDTGRSFAEGVAEKLVDDLLTIQVETMPGKTAEVPGEFIEAVQLQVVCQNLWQELPPDEKQITFQHLEKYGNVEQVLSSFYDETIRTAAKKAGIDEEGLRRLCGEVLITTMGTRGMVYQAQEFTGGVPNAAIEVLENMHLIRAEKRAGARWYELTHDRFIDPILASNKVFNDKLAEEKRAEREWEVEKKGAEEERERIRNLIKRLIGLAAFSIIILLVLFIGLVYLGIPFIEPRYMSNVIFSPDGKYVATASNDNISRVWDASTGNQTSVLNHTGSVNDIIFSPDGKYIATASDDNTARVWSAATGKLIFVLKHDGEVRNVVFSPNEKYVATASEDNTACLWDAATGKQIFVLNHDNTVNNIVFSPDGKYVATASDDKTAGVWDVAIGKQIYVMKHDKWVKNVVFSPDGKYVATASNDNTARVWDVATGKQIFVLNHDDWVSNVVFSPDGKYVATASFDNTACLWDATTGKQIFVLNHTRVVNNVVFSPDGKYIATASDDKKARVWDAATGRPVFVLKHDNGVKNVVFSPDGKYVATASNDNTECLWDATTGKQIFVLNNNRLSRYF